MIIAIIIVSSANCASCQVSYGSELSNRGPTFDMDLSDFMDGNKPISYEKAKEFFAQDPSQKWVTLFRDWYA